MHVLGADDAVRHLIWGYPSSNHGIRGSTTSSDVDYYQFFLHAGQTVTLTQEVDASYEKAVSSCWDEPSIPATWTYSEPLIDLSARGQVLPITSRSRYINYVDTSTVQLLDAEAWTDVCVSYAWEEDLLIKTMTIKNTSRLTDEKIWLKVGLETSASAYPSTYKGASSAPKSGTYFILAE